MQNPFYSEQDNRVRAFVRISIAMGVFFGLVLVLSVLMALTAPLFNAAPTNADPLTNPVIRAVTAVVQTIAAVILLVFTGRLVDRRARPWFDYGLVLDARWWADLVFGLVLGGLMVGGIFLAGQAAGWFEVTGTAVAPPPFTFGTAMLLALVGFIGVGISEELLFRSYFIPNVAEGMRFMGRTWAVTAALLLTSLIFGVAHAANPNATVVSTLNIALAGILLGLPFVLTGRVALPIGVHITWNFFLGNVFGFPVSGLAVNTTTLLQINQNGPALWTGGEFGPEAGLMGIIAILAGIGASVLWVRLREGHVRLQTTLADYTPLAPRQDDGTPA